VPTKKKIKKITFESIKANDDYLARLSDSLSKKQIFKVDKTLVELLKSFLKQDFVIPNGSKGRKDLIKIGNIMAITQEQREQTASVKVDYLKKQGRLNSLYFLARTYIYNNYKEFMYEYKTVEIRTDVINSFLIDLVEKQNVCEAIIEVGDLVLETLKDRYFTLCKINDICLATMPEKIRRDM